MNGDTAVFTSLINDLVLVSENKSDQFSVLGRVSNPFVRLDTPSPHVGPVRVEVKAVAPVLSFTWCSYLKHGSKYVYGG